MPHLRVLLPLLLASLVLTVGPPPARPADETEAGPDAGEAAEVPAVAPQPLTREQQKRVNALLKAADDNFLRCRLERAEADYREVLYIAPLHVHAQRRLADCLIGRERYPEALQAYERLQGLQADGEQDRAYVADLDEALALARECVEELVPHERSMPLADVEKRAFRDQAVREATIYREAKDYGSALRAMGYAEWMGRDIGAPLEGHAYNDLVVEAVKYHMEGGNDPAIAGLFDLADFLGIHSQERAELETQFEISTKGEAKRIAAAAAPYLSALDEEVQARKVMDAAREKERRRSALERIKLVFSGLIQDLMGYRRYRAALATRPPPTAPQETKKYVHTSSRRLDYGQIVQLNEVDAALYAAQPLLFRMTPGEWQARAALSGYPQREPHLPKGIKNGQFVVAMERDEGDLRHYYFLLDDLSDPRAQVLGRYATRSDAEQALEFYAVTDYKFTEATYAHE